MPISSRERHRTGRIGWICSPRIRRIPNFPQADFWTIKRAAALSGGRNG